MSLFPPVGKASAQTIGSTLPPVLRDPFHRELRRRLDEKLAARVEHLAAGGATTTDLEVISTAEKYAAQVTYIQALRDVLAMCDEMDRERYGSNDEEGQD